MNQKDYKEIVGIINKAMDLKLIFPISHIAEEIANYFEREEQKRLRKLYKNRILIATDYEFNRQQFLKDCGVN